MRSNGMVVDEPPNDGDAEADASKRVTIAEEEEGRRFMMNDGDVVGKSESEISCCRLCFCNITYINMIKFAALETIEVSRTSLPPTSASCSIPQDKYFQRGILPATE